MFREHPTPRGEKLGAFIAIITPIARGIYDVFPLAEQTNKTPSIPHIKIQVIDRQDYEPAGTPAKGIDSQQAEELKLKTENSDSDKGLENKKTGGRCGFSTGN